MIAFLRHELTQEQQNYVFISYSPFNKLGVKSAANIIKKHFISKNKTDIKNMSKKHVLFFFVTLMLTALLVTGEESSEVEQGQSEDPPPSLPEEPPPPDEPMATISTLEPPAEPIVEGESQELFCSGLFDAKAQSQGREEELQSATWSESFVPLLEKICCFDSANNETWPDSLRKEYKNCNEKQLSNGIHPEDSNSIPSVENESKTPQNRRIKPNLFFFKSRTSVQRSNLKKGDHGMSCAYKNFHLDKIKNIIQFVRGLKITNEKKNKIEETICDCLWNTTENFQSKGKFKQFKRCFLRHEAFIKAIL